MRHWNISAATLFILSFVVFLMLLIVVLPDVDLPDTAFHRGTGPVAIHALATAAPTVVTVAAVYRFPITKEGYRPFYRAGDLIRIPAPKTRPILLRSIRC